MDMTGPIGFRHIETAPRDGSWILLRFRRREDEVRGRWKPDAHLKAGGFWCDIQGFWITPGPLFWSPVSNGHQGGAV